MPLTYGSLFSGIGGFDLGFDRAGMQCAWQVEYNERARSVLERHWPDVPKYEDVRNVGRSNLQPVDLICGGFPCQDVSLAGKRAGLAGKRSGLWSEFSRIIGELAPAWVVIENVPGLLSSNGGADMGTVLWELADLGYGWAYRVLDAQYFGVAQRRRRVFIVGHLGTNGERAGSVLFEPGSLPWHPAPRRTQRQGVAGTLAAGAHPSGFNGRDADAGNVVAAPRVARLGKGAFTDPVNDNIIAPTLTAANPSRRGAPDTIAPPLKAQSGSTGKGDGAPVVFQQNQRDEVRDLGDTAGALAAEPGAHQQNDGGQHKRKDRPEGGMYVKETDTALTVGGTDQTAVCAMVGPRHLTPTECERLQGFPDGWTAGQSDSARYQQLGNAVAVPVAAWIGRRIMEVR